VALMTDVVHNPADRREAPITTGAVRAVTVRAALIQRFGGMEAPAVRRWELHRSSSIVLSNRRPHALPVQSGFLEMAALPAASTLAFAAGQGQLSLHAETLRTGGARDDEWVLVGEAVAEGTAREVAVHLVYHGVHRNGDRAYARLRGTVETSTVRRRFRRRPELALVVDLLFSAPATQVVAQRHGGPAAGATDLQLTVE